MADGAVLNSGKSVFDILPLCLIAANVHYSMFGKFLISLLPQPQLQDSTSHYRLYGKFVEGSSPFFMDCKGENVQSEGVQYDNGNTGHLSSDNGSKSEGKKNTGREGKNGSSKEDEDNAGGEDEDGSSGKDEDDASSKDQNNTGGENKDDNSGKSENNNDGEGEDNASRNGATLNMKLRVEDGDKTSNLARIVAGKLGICYITNVLVDIPAHDTITSNYPIVPLVVPMVPLISRSTALSNTVSSFLTCDYLAPSLFVFLVSGLSAFPQLGLSIILLISFDAFSPNFSLALIVDNL